MLKKLVGWFVCFGLSFLVANVFGWTDQGRAFLYIHLGTAVIAIAIEILIILIAGIAVREKLVASGISVVAIILFAIEIGIVLFATWGVTKLFDVEFFVAYQIITFVACIITNLSHKSSSKSNLNSNNNY